MYPQIVQGKKKKKVDNFFHIYIFDMIFFSFIFASFKCFFFFMSSMPLCIFLAPLSFSSFLPFLLIPVFFFHHHQVFQAPFIFHWIFFFFFSLNFFVFYFSFFFFVLHWIVFGLGGHIWGTLVCNITRYGPGVSGKNDGEKKRKKKREKRVKLSGDLGW